MWIIADECTAFIGFKFIWWILILLAIYKNVNMITYYCCAKLVAIKFLQTSKLRIHHAFTIHDILNSQNYIKYRYPYGMYTY